MADNEKNLYADLDCINDTRLGTLALLSQDAAVEALDNLYIERYTDDPRAYCTGVTFEAFKERYEKRDSQTLAASFPTAFTFKLPKIIADIHSRQFAGNPDVGKVKFIVNIWPYRLTDDECTELRKVLRVYVGALIPVELVFVPIREVTTEWINANGIAVAHIYSAQEWLDFSFNVRTDIPAQCPGVTFHVPALLLSTDVMKTHDEFKANFGRMPDVFAMLSRRCIQFMNIEWVSSVYYSIAPELLLGHIPDPPKHRPIPDHPHMPPPP